MANLRFRVLPRFPARLFATGGLAIDKNGADWTVEPNWSMLALTSDSSNKEIWVRDTASGVYSRMAASDFIANAANVTYLQDGAGAVARSVESRLRYIVSIEDFGADENSSDNRAAIQAAIDATPAGGTLYIPTTTGAVGYVVTENGSNGYALRCTKPIHIVGGGGSFPVFGHIVV